MGLNEDEYMKEFEEDWERALQILRSLMNSCTKTRIDDISIVKSGSGIEMAVIKIGRASYAANVTGDSIGAMIYDIFRQIPALRC